MKQGATRGNEIERKLRLSMELLAFAYAVKLFQLRRRHPELSEVELRRRTWELIEKGNR